MQKAATSSCCRFLHLLERKNKEKHKARYYDYSQAKASVAKPETILFYEMLPCTHLIDLVCLQ